MVKITLNINGRLYERDINPEMRLVDFIREEAKLKGTKEGCGEGECGACTVIVDGHTMNSCLLLAVDMEDKNIITIEGVAGKELHPLQQAFMEVGASQCGYCTPGMILSAKALLDENIQASEGEIREAISGNLCRCTGYEKIVQGVLRAQEIMTPQKCINCTSVVQEFSGVVGKGLIRPDVHNKVLGKALYPDDLYSEGGVNKESNDPEDVLYAGVKRSTIPYGRVKSINIEEIRKMPGVELVIDHTMIPGAVTNGVVFKDIPTLVSDMIKRVGDAILLVVARDKCSLKRALDKVKIEYEELPGIFSVEEALKEGAPILGDGSNILYDLKIKKGDIEKGFKEAKYVVEDWFNTPMVDHAFLQPEACMAQLNEEGTMEVYVATQYPHYDREEVARCLGFSEDKVKIVNMAIGGAFGAREDINPQCHGALAAYLTRKPVKIIYTREESTLSHSKRHPMKIYMKTGVREDGTLCAMEAKIYGDTGAYASWGMNVLRKAGVHATGPYRIDNVDIRTMAIYTNNPYAGAMRGFGATQVPIATETQMDQLAEKLGIHPLKFRHMNAFKVGDKTATGQELKSSVGIRECLEKLAEIDKVNLLKEEKEDIQIKNYWKPLNKEKEVILNVKALESDEEINEEKTLEKPSAKGGI